MGPKENLCKDVQLKKTVLKLIIAITNLRDPWLVLPGLSRFGLGVLDVPGAMVPVSCSSKAIIPSMSLLILCSSRFNCLKE